MKKVTKILAMATALTAAITGSALATPSTQIWIPSTDIQAFKSVHLGIDNYVRLSGKTDAYGNTLDIGVTAGVLPFEKLQAEIGVDYMESGLKPAAAAAGLKSTDSNPVYFNWKIGTPEDSLFPFSPAIAVGMYNMGTEFNSTRSLRTAQNISYGLVAKTLPVVGRFSVGGYHSAETSAAYLGGVNNGLLASWDRTLSEIDDRLWVAVDYKSGNNANGALSFGLAWAFSKNVSLIVGYDVYNKIAFGGKPTFNTQLDINIP